MLTLDPASLGCEEHPLCFPQGTSQLRVDYHSCQEPLSCNVCQEHAGAVWCVLWTATINTLNKLPLISLQLRI